MSVIGQGLATRVAYDWEASNKVIPAFASRRTRKLPYNSISLARSQPLQESASIFGDRAPGEPFLGNVDVSGDITVPVDSGAFLDFIQAATGEQVITEVPNTASDKLDDDAPPVTMTVDGAGEATFSEAQDLLAVGDRVLWTDANGAQQYAFVTAAGADTTKWDLHLERDGTTIQPTITVAVTVNFINENLGETVIGTCTIVAGVGTFSVAQTSASIVVGGQVLLDIENAVKRYFISVKTSTTVMTLVDGEGFAAPNGTALEVECLERQPSFDHIYTVAAFGDTLRTMVVEKLFSDKRWAEEFIGLKINSIGFSLGGDGELTANLNFLGADCNERYVPYDREDIKVAATVGISSGTITFTVSQTGATIGDIIVYRGENWEGGDAMYRGILTAGSGVSWTITDLDGNTPADIAALSELAAIYTDTDISINVLKTRFYQFDWAAYIDNVPAFVSTFDVNFSNGLDGSQYFLGGGGVRRELVEGRVTAGGSVEVALDNDEIVQRARAERITALKILGTKSGRAEEFEIIVDQARLDRPDLAVSGPEGLKVSLDWQGFKNDSNTYGSIIRFRIRSLQYVPEP